VVLSENTESGAYKSSIKLTRLPNFILFFIIQSFKGVIDTALRGFARNLDIKPECINYPIDSTPARMPMNLFMNVVSLLPCSVSVIREEQGVLVHVSAKTKNTIYELATATQRNRETCFNGGFLQRGGHFNPKRVVTTSFALIAFALFAITSVSRGV
jgi:multisubunit Na+/H+ antiporter MnhE subunit